MSFSPALVYDFIFLAVFSFAAVKSWQKGFLAGLTELIGAVLGVGIASWGSRTLAPEVYLSFFSDSVSTRVEQAVAQSGGDIAAAVQGLDFLPESIRAALAAGLQTAGDQLPEKINALLEPLFLPLVQALLFVLLCMIVRWVFALLVRLLRGVNLIPLVGGANRLLGLVLGLVTGAFDCWLLALLLWFAASITTGQIDWLTTGVLQRSVGYSLFGAFNPFLLHDYPNSEHAPPKLAIWQGLFNNSSVAAVRRAGDCQPYVGRIFYPPAGRREHRPYNNLLQSHVPLIGHFS